MFNEKNIQKELKQIAPQLFEIIGTENAKNVFKVPNNYFVDNAEIIDKAIIDGEVSISNNLKTVLDKKSLNIPTNYFENLTERTLDNIKNIEVDSCELTTNFKQVNPYKTPDNYFEGLQESVLESIYAETDNWITDLKGEDEFKIPSGYFDGLNERVLDRIKLEEKGGRVIDLEPEVQPKKAENVVDFNRYIKRASSAAAVLLVMFFGVYLFNNIGEQTSAESFDINNALAQVSDDELNKYIISNADEFDLSLIASNFETEDVLQFNNLDADNIQKYLLEELDDFLIEEIF